MKITRKIKNTAVLSMIILSFNFLYVIAQDNSFEMDGSLNFNNPSAIASALENNQVNAERLFREGSPDQVESVFSKSSTEVQSKILSFYSASDVVVNGQAAFDNGVIITQTTGLNLNEFKNFDGTITVNSDGSITILPNTNAPLQLDNNQITSSKEFAVSGSVDERFVVGSDITLKNSMEDVTLKDGIISIKNGHYTLQEYSTAEFSETIINTHNTKVDIGFSSGYNSYAIFDQSGRQAKLIGNDFSVEFTKNSPYDFVDVDGTNIRVVNRGLKFTFDKEKTLIDSNLGRGEKNMILKNLQSNHKVGIGLDGGFVGYKDISFQRVGIYQRNFFFIHGYDVQLELDVDSVKKDYEILVGKLPENLNGNQDFQNFVAEHADTVRISILPKVTQAQDPEEILSEFEKEIRRSGAAYTQLSGGKIRINDPMIQSQREMFEGFIAPLGGFKDGSEMVYTIQNGQGFVDFYPDASDKTNKMNLQFPNDLLMRKVLLPVYITSRNNVKDMPAALLCGTLETRSVC